ncbi:MAG TPA: hypothetical protein VGU20_09555 [Stellaceae bacterium]|nr:hypothetical protein [Stellaceae bacterium]
MTYSNAANIVATTDEYLRSFQRFSRYQVSYLHVTHGAKIACDLAQFDAVLQSYCVRLSEPELISRDYLDRLRAYRGVKAAAVQDEYFRTGALRRELADIGFDIVFTCVPPAHIEQIYPRAIFSRTEFVTVLTGYVPDILAEQERPRRPLRDRPVVIGYRGRDIGSRYGRLAFEKYEIGRRMREICVARAVRHDIEVAEEKRIYGNHWYEFVESCRAMLGTESGSNIFDDDGTIEARYETMSRELGRPVGYDEFRPYTEAQDRSIDMGQISPRIFEAAALKTPLILFTGRYSNAISPGDHYIELKKDFSNVDQVLNRLDDIDGLEEMAERAYAHLIGSGAFGYRQFVRQVENAIDRRRTEKGFRASAASEAAPSWQAAGAFEAAGVPVVEVPTPLPRHPLHFQHHALLGQHRELVNRYNQLWADLARPGFLAKLALAAVLPQRVRDLRRRGSRTDTSPS